jgi:tRNA-specific adenosine deaminase 2
MKALSLSLTAIFISLLNGLTRRMSSSTDPSSSSSSSSGLQSPSYYMRLALEQARMALESDEVPVGCVIVDSKSGQVIGSGYNATNRTKNGSAHCELIAIQSVLSVSPSYSFSESILFVTVEPCIMCTEALKVIKIGLCYFGCWNERFGGCGGVLALNQQDSTGSLQFAYDEYKVTHLDSLTVDDRLCVSPCTSSFNTIGGLFKEEAIEILKEFYKRGNPNAPNDKRHRELLEREEPLIDQREQTNKQEKEIQ